MNLAVLNFQYNASILLRLVFTDFSNENISNSILDLEIKN